MFQVMLGWYEEDWDVNPFAVSRESFYSASCSKPYTRQQAEGYIQAARARANAKGSIDLVDIELIDADSEETVWEWHKHE